MIRQVRLSNDYFIKPMRNFCENETKWFQFYIRFDARFLPFFKMKLLFANLTLLNALPSVIWHGMGDTANSAGSFKIYVQFGLFSAYITLL